MGLEKKKLSLNNVRQSTAFHTSQRKPHQNNFRNSGYQSQNSGNNSTKPRFQPMQKQANYAANKSNNQEKSKYSCFKCGGNHFARDCKVSKSFKQPQQQSSNIAIDKMKPNNWGFLVGFDSTDSNIWIIDSGATSHMCNDASKFINLTMENNGIRHVTAANKAKVNVVGIGSCKFDIMDANGILQHITLSNVLYVPDLGCNLISVRTLTRKGFMVNFGENHGHIALDSNTSIPFEVDDGLYFFKPLVSTTESANIATAKSNDLSLWYQHFGHLSSNMIMNLQGSHWIAMLQQKSLRY